MKIKDSDIDRFILKPDDSLNLFLFSGTDYGLSCTRFNNLISSSKIYLVKFFQWKRCITGRFNF